MTLGLRVVLGSIQITFKTWMCCSEEFFGCLRWAQTMTQYKISLQYPVWHVLQKASGSFSRDSLNFFFLSSGYLIICGGKRWVWRTNKRCLNKLAPGHIIQTLGIVLCWQASTRHEPVDKLLWGWVELNKDLSRYYKKKHPRHKS